MMLSAYIWDYLVAVVSLYDDPAYADVREDMHTKLIELRKQYKDSDENDKKYIESYLSATSAKK